MTGLVFAVPGDIGQVTGGYGYDRRMSAELKRLGWTVEPMALPDSYPFPSAKDEAAADARLAAIPEGSTVVVDGLAFGAMARLAHRHEKRLRLVALVHHPLALETGLTAGQAESLRESERRALQAACLVVATSRTTARSLEVEYGVETARIVVAEPGTDPAGPAARAGDPPVLLSVGSVVPRKGYDVLVDALASLKSLHWRCRIVGGGEAAEAASLRRRIAEAGLVGRIVLAGQVDDIGREFAHADIFVLASRYEGFGMAFAEAIAHGLPVIGCRAGAVPEVVPDDAGLLVPPDDASALASAIARLLTEPALSDALAAGARRRASDLPTWAQSARRLAEALVRL